MRNSNYTGRFPRDLNSAFGPYTSTQFEDDKPPAGYGWVWWGCMIVILMATVLIIGVTR